MKQDAGGIMSRGVGMPRELLMSGAPSDEFTT